MTHAPESERLERHLSKRVRRLKKAVAEARDDAHVMLEDAAASLPSKQMFPRVLALAGSKPIRMAANVVRRHPISSLLIAGVVIGTIVYHRRPREQ